MYGKTVHFGFSFFLDSFSLQSFQTDALPGTKTCQRAASAGRMTPLMFRTAMRSLSSSSSRAWSSHRRDWRRPIASRMTITAAKAVR